MVKMIVLLSGAVSSGKSTLASMLQEQFGFEVVKTWQLLTTLDEKISHDREALQAFGEKLDKETGGEWVAKELARRVTSLEANSLVVIDAIRIQGQIDAIRKGFGSRVKHIHLFAPVEALEKRYKKRRRPNIKEFESYDEVLKNETERNVPNLARSADVVVDTTRNTEEDVLVRAACHLGLYGRGYERVIDVLVGGQFGSEGKGQVAAYLSREYDVLIRVGGPNAGHKVYEEPETYTFHCLPSGSRTHGVSLVIGAGAVMDAATLMKEVNDCGIRADHLTIDPQVMIISDADRAAEKGLVENIGSTGQGVGVATARRIVERGGQIQLARDIEVLKPFVRPAYEVIENACRNKKRILLEGTQGTGLSLYHGCYPHVTSRDTTVAGCLAEAGISPSRVRRVIMVSRTYPIRVQNPDSQGKTSGPMSQELTLAEISKRSELPLAELQKTETTSTTRRKRRISEFDWVLLKKAAILNAPTDIALTFVDYLDKNNQQARRFEQLSAETVRFIQEVERVAEAPVSLISTRFHHRSIIDRRSW